MTHGNSAYIEAGKQWLEKAAKVERLGYPYAIVPRKQQDGSIEPVIVRYYENDTRQ